MKGAGTGLSCYTEFAEPPPSEPHLPGPHHGLRANYSAKYNGALKLNDASGRRDSSLGAKPSRGTQNV